MNLLQRLLFCIVPLLIVCGCAVPLPLAISASQAPGQPSAESTLGRIQSLADLNTQIAPKGLSAVTKPLSAQRVAPQSPSACAYLTPENAAAILSGAVEPYLATTDQCGYYVIEDATSEEAYSSVALIFARGDDAIDYLDQIAADIADQRPRARAALRRQIDGFLEEGDLRAALVLLPEYAARQRTMQFAMRPDAGESVIGVVWPTDDVTLRGLIAVHPNGDLILLLANLYQREDQSESDAALVAVMQAILAGQDAPVAAPSAPLVQGSVAPKESAPPAVIISPEERLDNCYGLQPSHAEAILGEAVTPEFDVDSHYGYCIYASVAANQVTGQDDLLPTAGPRGRHQYLAITVWPVGSATDPLMYLSFAILDREHSKLNTFLQNFSGRAALVELADVETQLPGLSREFLPDLGDGALWYWQESTSGDHLAGIYAIDGGQRVVVQTLVNPARSQDEVRVALIDLVVELMQGDQP